MHRTLGICFTALALGLTISASHARQGEVKELPLEVVRTFKALQGEINLVAFSPDEKIIALGSVNSDTLFLYNVETGKEHSRIKLNRAPMGPFTFAFSADGKTIAWRETFPDGIVRIFDSANGKLLRQFGFGRVGGVAHSYGSDFSPDGKLFAVVNTSNKKTVELWSVVTGKPVRAFVHDLANSVAFAPDGKGLATQDMYGQVRLWDLNGKIIHQFDRPLKPRARYRPRRCWPFRRTAGGWPPAAGLSTTPPSWSGT